MVKFYSKAGFILSLVVVSIVFYQYLSPIVIKHGLRRDFTEDQISRQFEDVLKEKYETLILGNSRVYRGINPEKLKCTNSYNFAHDNDSFNQIYFRLKYVLRHNSNIRNCIIGIDFSILGIFSDTRNYVYKRYLDKDYLKDYQGNFNLKEEITTWYNTKIKVTFSPFIAATKNIVLNHEPVVEHEITPFGQSRDYHIDIKSFQKNKADFIILGHLENYLLKILEECKDNNIRVVFVFMPNSNRENEARSSDKIDQHIEYISRFTDNKETFFLNFMDSLSSNNHYSDFVHLKAGVSDQFTEQFLQKHLCPIID